MQTDRIRCMLHATRPARHQNDRLKTKLSAHCAMAAPDYVHGGLSPETMIKPEHWNFEMFYFRDNAWFLHEMSSIGLGIVEWSFILTLCDVYPKLYLVKISIFNWPIFHIIDAYWWPWWVWRQVLSMQACVSMTYGYQANIHWPWEVVCGAIWPSNTLDLSEEIFQIRLIGV